MNDDWRLRIDLHGGGFAHQLGERLDAEELEHDLERSFRDRVVVSVDDGEVFCYTGTRAQAEAAAQLVRQLADRHGWSLDIELSHWHPDSEQWEDPDQPEPATAADAEAEREQRIASERQESAEQGYPEFEVRVECESRGDAAALSDRLESEGMPNVHRWSYVLVGATDEDSAQTLAERLRSEVPSGATVTVERNRRAIYDDRLWSPFSVLGGLAG
jgi:hypothetical protein